jgi:hypothetical protein
MPPEAAHISLSYFDWTMVLALAALLWLLLTRFFRANEKLAEAVASLASEVAGLRAFVSETYVTKRDHTRDFDHLSEDIASWATRFERELETHRNECPGRRP